MVVSNRQETAYTRIACAAVGINPNTFSADVSTSVLSRTEGDDRSMGFSDSKGFGVVTGWITRERTWKFRATRLQRIKVTRRERQVLCVVTGMPRMATSQLKGVWAGAEKEDEPKKKDHAKYKEGSERKVQRLKGRLLATWLS